MHHLSDLLVLSRTFYDKGVVRVARLDDQTVSFPAHLIAIHFGGSSLKTQFVPALFPPHHVGNIHSARKTKLVLLLFSKPSGSFSS